MGRVSVDRERCKGCLLCTDACPTGHLSKDGGFNSRGYYTVGITDVEGCNGCALCAEVCPDVAIEVWR